MYTYALILFGVRATDTAPSNMPMKDSVNSITLITESFEENQNPSQEDLHFEEQSKSISTFEMYMLLGMVADMQSFHRSIVGLLIWIQQTVRYHISYTTHRFASFLLYPDEKALRYLIAFTYQVLLVL